MIRVIWLLLFTSSLFAGTVINQNIYEKKDSIDIMLSFDAPYEGKIVQKKDNENTILILEGINITEKSTKDINSHIVQTMKLITYKNQLFIELSGVDAFSVDASKTVDNYGLRLRIKPFDELSTLAPVEEKTFETKKEDDIGSAYLKVLLLLAGLIGFLYLLKNWLLNRGGNLKGSWLFDKNGQKEKSAIKIKQQRALDVKNRVALISYADKEYLILLGNTNLLLDTFQTLEKNKEHPFEEVLSQNKEALNDFIKDNEQKLDTYKNKVSTDF